MKKTESGHQLPFRVKRILLILLGLLLIAAGILVWRYIADYRNYNEYLSLIRQPEALAEAGGAGFPEDTLKAVPGFTLAADNGRVALYLKKETAEVAVYDRQSGQTVYSNPPDADRDPVARATNLENLKSQFIISYLDANSKEGTAWSSWAKSVSNGQVEYEPLPDGVRVVYSLSGEKMLLVPDQLTPEWFAVLSEAGKKQAAKSYEFNEASGLYEMKTRGVSARHRQQIDLDARGAGFTLEDYEEMQALKEDEEGGEEAGEILAFTVTLDWQLTEDGVRVTLPYEGLHESGKGKLRAVQLLPFFGAAGTEEAGTLVLPEGSGALMRFNNGKSSSPQYSKNVYDLDLVDSDYSATQNMQSVRLALFGICRESSSVLAVCERGASLAAITADTSGRNNSYNFAYFTFNLRRTDTLSIVGEEVIVAEKDLYPVDCSVRYTLLGEDRAGPSGMARACREKLIREGALAEAGGSAEDLPFYYDVIGGIKETAHFLGIQYLRVLPMTTFSQAEEIVSRLRHEGIANQCVNLQGWMNGGYYHDPVSRVNVLSVLGGENGLRRLKDTVEQGGGHLYPDASLQFITDIARGFLATEEACRYYADGYIVELGLINPVSLRRTGTLGYRELGFKLLSPKYLPRYARSLSDAAARLGLDCLSLRDLGQELHADKRRANVISREADLDLTRSAFETLRSGNRSLMVSGGNDYSFPYISHVLNAPLQSTSFPILDEEFPLWQMIVHGSFSYCGSAMNMTQSASARQDLLRLVEYGASVHYAFTYRDAADMKYTGLNRQYATTFSSWKDEAAEAYRFVNGALRPVSGSAMVSFDRLSGTLSRAVYDNGVTVYVNRGEADAEADGRTVKALDYLVVGGEAQ